MTKNSRIPLLFPDDMDRTATNERYFGAVAYRNGQSIEANPNRGDAEKMSLWRAGWFAAQDCSGCRGTSGTTYLHTCRGEMHS